MKHKLIIKKFETQSEKDAFTLVQKLNAGKYRSINMGTGVVSECRQTKKLEKILSPFGVTEFIPSDYDIEKLKEVEL